MEYAEVYNATNVVIPRSSRSRSLPREGDLKINSDGAFR